MKRKAFTLIELLVVVAIIAVLVAILLPALNNAREMARGIDCVSRLHQVSMAVLMYSDDYHGVLPGRNLGHPMWAHWKYREQLVVQVNGKWTSPYGINREIQGHCPSRPKIIGCWEGINYWYNRWSCSSGFRLTDMAEPAATTFIIDGPPIDPFPHMIWISHPDGLGYVHSRRAGVQFLDGHASLLGRHEVTESMLDFKRQ